MQDRKDTSAAFTSPSSIGIDIDSAKSILHFLLTDNDKLESFSQYCDQRPYLFGPKGGPYRRKCQYFLKQQRDKLLKEPQSFAAYLRKNNLEDLFIEYKASIDCKVATEPRAQTSIQSPTSAPAFLSPLSPIINKPQFNKDSKHRLGQKEVNKIQQRTDILSYQKTMSQKERTNDGKCKWPVDEISPIGLLTFFLYLTQIALFIILILRT